MAPVHLLFMLLPILAGMEASRMRVLVADDDVRLASVVRRGLSEEGMRSMLHTTAKKLSTSRRSMTTT